MTRARWARLEEVFHGALEVSRDAPGERSRYLREACAGHEDLEREDILAAISKHIIVDRDNIQVRMDRGDQVSALEINIEIPHSAKLPGAAGF